MIEQSTVSEFLNDLSSKQPVPGGGGASALSGAVGAALGAMVANLTTGKKKYIEVEEEINKILKKLEDIQSEFIALSDADAKVFTPLAKAYGMPADTEEEKVLKEKVMEQNLLNASLVPIELMEKSIELMDLLEVLAKKGSRLALSDVGVGIQLAKASLLGAVMNVYINTRFMKDREKADELNRHASRLVNIGSKKADDVYQIVLSAIL